jgi:hypothetical protein
MQPTGWTGAELRTGGKGSSGVLWNVSCCGRKHDRLQLMRGPLGASRGVPDDNVSQLGVCGMRGPSLCFMLMLSAALPLHGQDLEAADVRVTLDSALRIAHQAAATAFPELSNYLLYSITPRVLKGDPGGLH